MKWRALALTAGLIPMGGEGLLWASSSIASSAGTGGAAFLYLNQGSARAMGMGNSFVAVADGADAMAWNPAGIARTEERQLQYSYLSYVQGLNTPVYMAYVQPMGRTVVGANFSYISDSNFDVRDANGIPQPNSTIQVHDGFGSIAIARSFWYERLFLGAALRDVSESNAGASYNSVVGDLGLIFKPNNRLSFGLSGQNLGASMANVYSIVRSGVGFRVNDFLTLTGEVDKPQADNTKVGVGGEFQIPEQYLEVAQLTLRAGWYNLNNMGQSFNGALETLHLNETSGFTFGLGMYTSQAFGYGLGIDYAFVPFGALGVVEQISLTLKF
ncbi:MAG: PorV/PorQ family protein [Elusimicrobiota bacterium]